MTEPLAHDRAVEELEIVSLGAAPPEVTAGVLAHAAECVDCRGELDELTLLLAALTSLMPEVELNRGRSAGIRSRLMARANADTEAAAKREVDAAARRKAQSPVSRTPALTGRERLPRVPEERVAASEVRESPLHPQPLRTQSLVDAGSGSGRGLLLVWASVATVALLGSSAAAFVMWCDRAEPRPPVTSEVAELEAREDSLLQALAEKERAVQMLVGPTVRVVDLVSSLSSGRPIARVFWDTQNNHWSLFVYELRPARADHTYQLWALTAQGRISAGTFIPPADGTTRMEMAVTLDPEVVRSVFITEEPVPGSRQPTGRPLAAGSL